MPVFVSRFLFLLALLTLCAQAWAGTVKGRITDAAGEALPFANIYEKTTQTGTTSNEDGYYQFTLPAGRYQVTFQYVGYKAKTEEIEVGEGTVVRNVVLEAEAFSLREVEVGSRKEDPAYPIIREAIRKRKYHLNEIAAYSCQVYVKGLQRLTNVPPKVLGFNVAGLEKGIVYLSESVSELYWQHPGKYRERMISSKISGQNKRFSFNKASDMDVNFYRNLIEAEGLSERGFVSPIANNALMFYRYELIGSNEENGQVVHKIKVRPIRRNDPAFSGHIYILEGSWRIHSLDLGITKNNGVEFVDTLRVNQVFAPVSQGPWVLRSQKFTFNIEAFGFTGNGYFLGVYSKYKVQPAYTTPAPAPAAQPAVAANEEKKPEPAPKPVRAKKSALKRALKEQAADTSRVQPPPMMKRNEVMRVEEDANKRDSAYWAEIRPVPLTEEEVKDYLVKDSISEYRESKVYKDSVDAKRNRISYSNVLLGGYTYSNSWREKYFTFDPIFRIWQYNTVEGVVANLRFGYNKRYQDRRRWEVAPTVRYGFANELFSAKLAAEYTYKPTKFSTVAAEGGRFVSQFNADNPITPFINSVYTLLREENFMKLYYKEYGRVNWRSEVVNGLQLSPYVEFAERSPLFNSTDDKLVDLSRRQFTPNQPENAELDNTYFNRHQSLMLGIAIRYRPGLEYMTRPDRKINLGTDKPAFNLHYRRGVPGVLSSDVNYDYLGFRIDHDISLGLVGSTSYKVGTGGFLSSKEIFFMDYRHFQTNQTILAGSFEGFQLLDYYRYSTRKVFLEGHVTHYFNGFIFNKIPLFRRLRWQETATLNYLYTRELGHYAELGLGIEHIFKLGRVDFYTGFQEGQKVSSGVRIGFGF